MCDSTGLNPATTAGDYYNSPYQHLMRIWICFEIAMFVFPFQPE